VLDTCATLHCGPNTISVFVLQDVLIEKVAVKLPGEQRWLFTELMEVYQHQPPFFAPNLVRSLCCCFSLNKGWRSRRYPYNREKNVLNYPVLLFPLVVSSLLFTRADRTNIPVIHFRSASYSISCPVPGTSQLQPQYSASSAVLPLKIQVFYWFRFSLLRILIPANVTEQGVTKTRVVQLPMFTQRSQLAQWVATFPALNHSKKHSRSAIGWRSVWISIRTFWSTYIFIVHAISTNTMPAISA
jgi:hypothetical protein